MEIHLNFEEGMYDVNGKPIIMVHIFLFIYKFVLKSEKQCTFCPLNNCLIYLRHTCELQDKLEDIQLYINSFLLFPFSGHTKTPLISMQVAFFTSVL